MFDPETPPELSVSGWVNASEPLSLERLRGRVVVVVVFQMLCPGCIENALPQAKRLRARFNPAEVAIVGLHSAFEHQSAMTPEAIEAFVDAFKLPFPVAIDEADREDMPRTMTAYQMQGTPTLLLFDRAGRLRRHYFGQPDDMLLAAEIMGLAIEEKTSPRNEAAMIERKFAATLLAEGARDSGNDHHHHHGDDCDCGHDHHHHGHDHQAHGDHDCDICKCGHDREPHPVEETAQAAGSAVGDDRAKEIARRLAGSERMTEPPRDKS